jgi:DNA-binding XRE family transcriptional regulator
MGLCKFFSMREKLAQKIQNEAVNGLIKRRKELGLSHEKLAVLAGLHRTAISHIENRRRNPTLLVCLKLAAALGCQLSEVIKEAEKR